jgi:phosphopantothenoylcysteine decarboxylase / phosphopantothenate---cysteine ligase
MLEGKKILVGVTGSIAAYKAAFLIRSLVKEGAEVKVVMTNLAKEFITPLTLATLSKNPVLIDFFDPENGNWNNHVDLGIWADAYLIAPATANTIGKIAHGICDNLLLTTYLSMRCPVFIAPAMDVDMYQHISTQENLKKIAERGNIVIEPVSGYLASGIDGQGRMEEPERIVEILKQYFFKKKPEKKKPVSKLTGKKVLITAGPTFEPFDPVRYIGNYSTGKMGYAIAEAFAESGSEVFLISGPTGITPSKVIQHFIQVRTSDEMYTQCCLFFPTCDVAILSAAVADYKPNELADRKIKSSDKNLEISLVKTIDIAMELGRNKKVNQLLVGFALETDNEIANAREKLLKKNFDLIVLNSLKDAGAGFGFDTNKITILDKDNKINDFKLKSKNEVAQDILRTVAEKMD